MAVKRILLAGDELLYEKCESVKYINTEIKNIVEDLKDTLHDFRQKNGFGRGIAAPQIGKLKRIIYIEVGKPMIIINPSLEFVDDEKILIWDDCFSFPCIQVRVKRYKRCILKYRDEFWNENEREFDGGMSELIQHEYDHLDGILALARALDGTSFKMTG